VSHYSINLSLLPKNKIILTQQQRTPLNRIMNQVYIHPAYQEFCDEVNPFGTEQLIQQDQQESPRKANFIRNRLLLCLVTTLLSFFGSWVCIGSAFQAHPTASGPSPLDAVPAVPTKAADMWEECIYDESERYQNATILTQDNESFLFGQHWSGSSYM